MFRHHLLTAPRHSAGGLVEGAVAVLLLAMLIVAIPLMARVPAPTDLAPRPMAAPAPVAVDAPGPR